MAAHLPDPVLSYLQSTLLHPDAVACVLVEGGERRWCGDPARLGLRDSEWLEAIRVGLPSDQSLCLPLVHSPEGVALQIHQIVAPPQIWLLLMTVTEGLEELSSEQQQAHEMTLRNRAQQKLIGTLEHAAQVLAESEAELKRAAQAQELFIRGIAHELGTPLTAVMGHVERLGARLDDEESRRMLTAVQRGVLHLNTLVQGALDRDRLSRGSLRVNPVRTALAPLLGEVADLLGPQASDKGLRLRLRCEPLELMVDGLRLRQILINLLSNAIKYTSSGVITLSAGCSEHERVRIAVIDQGSGLTAEQQAQMFEPFERFHTGMASGHGLGLYITQQLAVAIGATLGVHSAPGEGSTFWIELPVGRLQQVQVRAQHRSWLLIDDDEEVRELLLLCLDGRGLRVCGGASLEQLQVDGLPLLRQSEHKSIATATEGNKLSKLGDYDGALVDLHLAQGRSGLDEIRRLRASGFDGRIVAMSADDDARSEESARAAGADAFIAKPFQLLQLFEVLDGNAA